MKKGITLVSLFILAITLSAQPRVDRQQQFKVLKSSPVITNIIGWGFDESSGKWAGYYNMIDPVYKKNNKIPIRVSAEHMSTCRNIVSLQTKKISYKESIYFAIIEVYWHSGFDYPYIYKGFYKYKNRAVYLFNIEEYNKLLNLNEEITTLNEHYIYAHVPASISLNEQLQDIFRGDALDYTSIPYKAYFKREDENTIRFTNDDKNPQLANAYFEMKQKDWKLLLIE